MKNPCRQCIVFAMCKAKFNDYFKYSPPQVPNVLGFASHSKCPLLNEYLDRSTQEMINSVRVLYGLEPFI